QPLRVGKIGRTTGYSEGVIDNWTWEGSLTFHTPKGPRQARFMEQLAILPGSGWTKFSEPGDSGAIVVELKSPRRAIGMVIGASGPFSIVTPIYRILKVLPRNLRSHSWEVQFVS
ncbi:MAG: hypothetical protein KC643_33690, partial [Nitrospira sp.]|nr:hypothetical protein [Nitrospira sp.]